MECANCFRDDVPLFIVTCDACYAAAPSSSVQCKSCIDARKRVNNHLVCIKCSSPTKMHRVSWYARCMPAFVSRATLRWGWSKLTETDADPMPVKEIFWLLTAAWVMDVLLFHAADRPSVDFYLSTMLLCMAMADTLYQRYYHFGRPVLNAAVALYSLAHVFYAVPAALRFVYILVPLSWLSHWSVLGAAILAVGFSWAQLVLCVLYYGLWVRHGVLFVKNIRPNMRAMWQRFTRSFQSEMDFVPV